MSNPRIVWEQPDGRIVVSTPVLREDTPAERRRIEQLSRPAGAALIGWVDATDLPSRRGRNCWRNVSGRVVIDAGLAREQRENELRNQCDRRLAALDATIPRGLEDQWEAQGFDALNRLPQASADKLRAKRDLRTTRAGLADALAALTEPDTILAYEPEWSAP